MKLVALVAGVLAALLGGLWLLQGLGAVRIEPVACVGECTPLDGPSPLWVALGAALLLAGAAAIFYAVRREGKAGR